ncbi:hypothetical protein BR93DRAFT_945367 [Coniochaeta sp. PMI_546]|nr:hypothetical protein BR93DRAFT_945367 [Coniochaeta sp. PMI_546]
MTDESQRRVTGSARDGRSDIVFSDPTQPFVVKPIIEDLLRTRYCIPGSVFLVEGIDTLSPIRRRYRAIRLLVSDGIKCVQAVLKGEAHGPVDNGQIYAGCYVRVDSFELRFLDILDGANDQGDGADDHLTVPAGKKRKREIGAQKMVYLLLENPVTVGWNTAYMKILDSQKQAPPPDVAVLAEESEPSPKLEGPVAAAKTDKAPLPATTDKGTLNMATSNLHGSLDHGSIADLDDDDLDFSDQPRLEALRPDMNLTKPSTKASSTVARQSSEPLPWSTDDPTKPVKLTPLRLVPNLPYKQNWMVNVLAVVSSLSDVEPSHLPPYHQRTARLTDPSTSKQVLLTVFLDPDDFDPAVGSVVLILGVKNHRFDGGSLKKYASDRPKNGARWWFEEPKELDWCDVANLKAWWESKHQTA